MTITLTKVDPTPIPPGKEPPCHPGDGVDEDNEDVNDPAPMLPKQEKKKKPLPSPPNWEDGFNPCITPFDDVVHSPSNSDSQ